jgi:hypothetical protein
MRYLMIAGLLAACSADRVTTVDPVLDVAAEAWSGDTLAIHSTAFTGADTTPLVTVGADTLPAWRGGPDTALVLLPDTGGTIHLAVRLHRGGVAFADVTVHGLVSAAPGPLTGDMAPYPWPADGQPTALAVQQGHLVLANYLTNSYRALTSDTDLWNPSCLGRFPVPFPSASDPSLVGVAHGCGPLEAVPVAAGAPAADTGPPTSGWTALHLSRGHWLVAIKNRGLLFEARQPDGSFADTDTLVGDGLTMSYVVSPDRTRVIPSHHCCALVAIDPAVPSVAFTVTGVGHTGGAAFSEGGDTLFAVVRDSANTPALLAVDAASGARLRSVPVGYWDLGVVVDPGRPWLYLVGVEGGFTQGQLAVYVYDRASFTRIATVRVPAAALPPNNSAALAGVYVPILDPVRRQLYLTNNSFVDPEFVFHFDLFP